MDPHSEFCAWIKLLLMCGPQLPKNSLCILVLIMPDSVKHFMYLTSFYSQNNIMRNILSLLHLNNIIDCGSELKFIWMGNGEDEI